MPTTPATPINATHHRAARFFLKEVTNVNVQWDVKASTVKKVQYYIIVKIQ